MKKTVQIILLLTLLASSSFVQAATTVPYVPISGSDAKYMTSEDILLALIEPKIEKMVRDQYKKDSPKVKPLKVTEAGMVYHPLADQSDGEGGIWFQLEVLLLVGDDSEHPKIDRVVVKIDAPYISGEGASDKMEGITVELVEYEKG
ncbi:hypothetical protein [Bacillus rubiinfantis]|uniref:hypothetical protein n=1 Tax=Bacillus rubiinfantis TaxID=1499680 RepID=UPI0005AA79C4|nr:hypothetical protein [Bacillus rubiinfantis]